MVVDIYNTDKKYKIIYADPPWNYKNNPSKKGTSRGFAKNYYNLLSVSELSEIPIKNICDKDSVCFMWTTFPMINKALETMEAWGFKYRTVAFVWIKKNRKQNTNFWGCGYYTRSNVEICLLGTRGKILERKSHSIHQIVESPVEMHSKKPDIVREKIIELFGNIPRIELFARQKIEGWDCWGNEVDKEEIIK